MILAYPFNIGPTGMAATDDGVGSQLAMLFNTQPGTRIFYSDYGVSVMGLEQELMYSGQSPERTLFAVAVTQKMAKYIPSILLSGMSFAQGDSESDINVTINYIYQGNQEDYVWQPASSLT
jgi:hypothetical protein